MNVWYGAPDLSTWASQALLGPQNPWTDIWDVEDGWGPSAEVLDGLETGLGVSFDMGVAMPSTIPLPHALSQDVKAAVEEIDSIVNELWRTTLPVCNDSEMRVPSDRVSNILCASPVHSHLVEVIPTSTTTIIQNDNSLQAGSSDFAKTPGLGLIDKNDDKSKHKCDKCDKCYVWLNDLVKHQKVHSGKRYKCSECDKGYVLKSDLIKHQRLHQAAKSLSCKHCEKSFTSTGDLHKHVRTHTGERPFFCNVCTKSFSASDNFRKHLKIHSGDKPLLCVDCGQRFLKKSNLQQHSRIHLGEKPFQCETCGLSFTQKTHLKSHIRTHSGLKPYFCSSCDQHFTRNADLKRHNKRAHSEENRGL